MPTTAVCSTVEVFWLLKRLILPAGNPNFGTRDESHRRSYYWKHPHEFSTPTTSSTTRCCPPKENILYHQECERFMTLLCRIDVC